MLGGALQAFMVHLNGFTLADLLPGSGGTAPTVQPIQIERKRPA